jgi:hypothetical protein
LRLFVGELTVTPVIGKHGLSWFKLRPPLLPVVGSSCGLLHPITF